MAPVVDTLSFGNSDPFYTNKLALGPEVCMYAHEKITCGQSSADVVRMTLRALVSFDPVDLCNAQNCS